MRDYEPEVGDRLDFRGEGYSITGTWEVVYVYSDDTVRFGKVIDGQVAVDRQTTRSNTSLDELRNGIEQGDIAILDE